MGWILVAAGSGALAVALGAFGAHALADRLGEGPLETWRTATHYHLLHSVALLALALYGASTGRAVAAPAWLWTAGLALFSGSLYLLVLTEQRWLGPVTPIGGLCLIAGWMSLFTLTRG